MTVINMPRQRPPTRHASENINFTCHHIRYTATIGRNEQGEIVEIFLNSEKVNSQADVHSRDAAVVCSIALQFGVPVEIIRQALMRDQNGKASGPLGTILDIIRR